MRLAVVILAALMASAALAGPVTLRCKSLDPNDARFCGAVVLTVDEAASHVDVAAPQQPDCDGDYTDGRRGFVSEWSGRPNDTISVTQFVRFTPNRVEFGWRSVERGGVEVTVWVERAALSGKAPCLTHLVKTYGAT